MPYNADIIKNNWSLIYEAAVEAEKNVYSAPRTSLFYSRLALERAINWLYANDDYLKKPERDDLYNLMYEQTFRENLTPSLFKPIDLIRRLGNVAVHSEQKVSKNESFTAFENLFHFLNWLQRYYSDTPQKDINFEPQLIPIEKQKNDKSAKELEQLAYEIEKKDKELKRILRENEELRKQIQINKKKNEKDISKETKPYSEAKTRQLFIDLMLREIGWDPHGPNVEEYELPGMPNRSQVGFADYVLWDDNGKPLAVIEAKRTTKSPATGKKQAELYADLLEKHYTQRPIIFYTNGYETWLWDDVMYPPRVVQGFYTKDQLRLMIERRSTRKNITKQTINKDTAGRYYQVEAIRRTAETFENKKRHALLIMATGTGKTRTAVALVELLMKAGWVKNVLFLADRKELVRQAKNAFSKYLPNTSVINLLEEKEDDTSRIIVSTYPTMMNLIDQTKKESKRFSVGHFDLLIVDESHRSIYKKYGAIFEYFDSLMIGLTATPKTDIDKNTYTIFELEDNVPTFAYDYQQAVDDKYLVPAQPIKIKMKIPRSGVKYSQLSDEEKEAYDEEFTDAVTGEKPEEISSSAINTWLFNNDTVDKALKIMMEKGIKVKGGDELGKTIIFAKNHNHAEFIAKRFSVLFPKQKGKFLEIIDNKVSYAESLLNDFKIKENYPQVAVSVDMLDTGIDIPEIVNLVILKEVHSKSKFWQMIGRGTRLYEDLFGPGLDKQEFYVFDFCGNIDFFEAFPEGKEAKAQDSLNEQLFTTRAKLIYYLQDDKEQKDFHQALIDFVSNQVAQLDEQHFLVRPHHRQVERFRLNKGWEPISEDSLREALDHLGRLVSTDDDEDVKRFDLLILKLQLSLVQPKSTKSTKKLVTNVIKTGQKLQEKVVIEAVKKVLPVIEEVQTNEFWENVTETDLERVRLALRNLIQYIDKNERKVVYTDFEDKIEGIDEDSTMPETTDWRDYRVEVNRFILNHQDHITIQKIRKNKQITPKDMEELEKILFTEGNLTMTEYEKEFGSDRPLTLFIREVLGMDQAAAKEAFSEFLEGTTLNANQIQFINKVIEFFTKNGTLDPSLLFDEPFTSIHHEGITGLFDDDMAIKLVSVIRELNDSVRITS
ncbi:DEAD/DEAH box helicase family protein [Bacillus sp. ISL-46]|uniref:DEAD/DEAH box helicase family protein n=1 Tax=Bacillus sp. ISL-46 TaxID=2819129 RepID=UPI001BE880D7|nr:DEAD/DEAH box helicase family protein [Bacillus sp. ISL-46]MBT2721460.1 DEAD/DEAH box helicase family protein [Bacillus sp. ISL-46]